MADILQIFSGNPLSTFIGKKIEAATRPELDREDWALNMEICDIINENDDDGKDAVRAIKKRLQQIEQDRNFIITNRTLTVLETCVSNCSHRFHVHVMTKDFIQDLVKLIGPKNNPPIDLQERVLGLIERWADAFRSQPDLGGVVSVYNDLKAKGVTFPPRDPNSQVPITTPRRSVPSPQPRIEPSIQQPQPRQPSDHVLLEGEGYTKISQDLTVVQSSIEMFNDILEVLRSPNNEESDWKLAADLAITCHQMKDRIVDLIERVANEDLTIEFLRLNDELNSIFTEYDSLIKNAPKREEPIQSQDTANTGSNQLEPSQVAPNSAIRTSAVSSKTLNELSLIDFDAAHEASARSDQTSFATKPEASVPAKETAVTSNIAATSSDVAKRHQQLLSDSLGGLSLDAKVEPKDKKVPEEISSVREQDFAEIENWLATDSGRDLTSSGGDVPNLEPISIPNSEFENFIANRALAGSSARNNENPTSGVKQQKPEPSA